MKSGVYVIRNVLNGNRYVGSTINFEQRCKDHFMAMRGGKHKNRHLQSAFSLYGEDAFEWQVLITCRPQHMLSMEQYCIDTLQPEYNISPTAGNCLGMRHTEETKRSLSIMKMGSVPWNKGIPRTEEVKQKLREKLTGKPGPRRGKTNSPETRAKISASKTGKPNRNKGMKLSDERRRQMSEQRKGKPSPLRGRKLPPEVCKKISAARIGIRPGQETREKLSASRMGKKRGPMSEATKAKIREVKRSKWLERKLMVLRSENGLFGYENIGQ